MLNLQLKYTAERFFFAVSATTNHRQTMKETRKASLLPSISLEDAKKYLNSRRLSRKSSTFSNNNVDEGPKDKDEIDLKPKIGIYSAIGIIVSNVVGKYKK